MSFAAMMVHVDVDRDCEQRVELAVRLAGRFRAALIGVAGLQPQPAFAAAGVVVYSEPIRRDDRKMTACFNEMATRFCLKGKELEHVEWRASLRPVADVLLQEARAADLIIVDSRDPAGNAADFADPGVILLRAGRPVLVVPKAVGGLALRRAVVAWKDTRECRRAVRDAVPLLQRADQVLLLGLGEDDTESQARQALIDVGDYLVRHGVVVSDQIWERPRGPVAGRLLHFVRAEQADLIVAGGYGHSRLGEWIFGGVTHELVAASPVCCMLSH